MSVETAPPPGVVNPAPPYSELGRPITGPRAVTGGWLRFWHLTFNIAFMQWKLRFFGSALGYLWQLVRPLLLFLVLYVFFTQVARIGLGEGASYTAYGAQLLSGIVLFTFFQEATFGAVRSVVDNEMLVRKIQFPRMVIPLSVVLLATFNLGLNLVVVLIFALVGGVTPMLSWLEVPVIVGLLVILCTGVSMLLSALFVYMRDIEPIWELIGQVLFYASPIIIPVVAVRKHISATLLHIYMLNPLATLFQQFRHAFITHATPSSATLLGSDVLLLIPVGIIVGIFVLGLSVFNRVAPRVAEDL